MKEAITTPLAGYLAIEILKQPERTITIHEPLISSGLVDSFSLVDLSLFIEETFGVLIDDTELTVDTFDTLAELAEIIRQRQA